MNQATEVDKVVGELVKLLRLEKRIPVEELAKNIGVSIGEYTQYELGESKFRPGVLMKLCDVLEIRPSRIFSNVTIE